MQFEMIPFERRRVIIKEQAAALLGIDSKAIDRLLAERYESDILDVGALSRAQVIAVMDFAAFVDIAMLVEGCGTAERIKSNILDPCSRGLKRSPIALAQILRQKPRPRLSARPETIASDSTATLVSGVARAISIRQPYVEQILRGDKTEEYRSMKTSIRERVYLYASQSSGADEAETYRDMGEEPGSFPTGLIVGTVEIIDCHWDDAMDCFAYSLAKPERLAAALKPINQPQPKFWLPQFRSPERG
jgi:hypothetical protein